MKFKIFICLLSFCLTVYSLSLDRNQSTLNNKSSQLDNSAKVAENDEAVLQSSQNLTLLKKLASIADSTLNGNRNPPAENTLQNVNQKSEVQNVESQFSNLPIKADGMKYSNPKDEKEGLYKSLSKETPIETSNVDRESSGVSQKLASINSGIPNPQIAQPSLSKSNVNDKKSTQNEELQKKMEIGNGVEKEPEQKDNPILGEKDNPQHSPANGKLDSITEKKDAVIVPEKTGALNHKNSDQDVKVPNNGNKFPDIGEMNLPNDNDINEEGKSPDGKNEDKIQHSPDIFFENKSAISGQSNLNLPHEVIQPQQTVYPGRGSYDDVNSHFFAYLLTMMVTAIIFYLLFHNKKKIIALMLEGRRSQAATRRNSRARYHKLDNNLEEAMTSTRGSLSSGY